MAMYRQFWTISVKFDFSYNFHVPPGTFTLNHSFENLLLLQILICVIHEYQVNNFMLTTSLIF